MRASWSRLAKRFLLGTGLALSIALAVASLAIDDLPRRGRRWLVNEWQGRNVEDFEYVHRSASDSMPAYLKMILKRKIVGLLVLPEVVPGGNPSHFVIETRGLDYDDMNALDKAALVNRMRLMGNDRAELITTSGKGYRWNGDRHPHSWSIVHEARVVQWMVTLFETHG
ncbi:MAG: hypothetical protein ACE5PT_02425 [Gemmatimonadales bacterium]